MLVATLRQQGRAQALQAQAIRTAVWGEAEAYGAFVGGLLGATRQAATDSGERDAALVRFGLRLA